MEVLCLFVSADQLVDAVLLLGSCLLEMKLSILLNRQSFMLSILGILDSEGQGRSLHQYIIKGNDYYWDR